MDLIRLLEERALTTWKVCGRQEPEASVASEVAVRAGGQFKPGKNGQEFWLYLKSSEKLLRDFKQSETAMTCFEKMTVAAIQRATGAISEW